MLEQQRGSQFDKLVFEGLSEGKKALDFILKSEKQPNEFSSFKKGPFPKDDGSEEFPEEDIDRLMGATNLKREIIIKALRESGGRIDKAAHLLLPYLSDD